MVAGRPLAAMVAAAVASSVVACSATSPSATGVTWVACDASVDLATAGIPQERLRHLTATCATVQVPLDHDAATGAGGEVIGVRLVRVRSGSTETERDPLLLVSGGPGQSGVDGALYAAGYLPPTLLDRFDLVGFDPRGVARSSPIHCPPEEPVSLPVADLTTEVGYEPVAARFRAHLDGCVSALGTRAQHFSTTATARDVDLVRAALGQERLTLLGWSYGAKLGAEYARLFPDRVRAAVLDAPTDPTVTWIETSERQVAGFEESFDRFVDWCATRTDCERLGDVRAFTGRLVAAADATPVPSLRPGDDRPATGADLLDGVASALYDDVRWPDLADGLAEAAAGDSGTLLALAEAGRGGPDDDTNSQDSQLVIICNDSAPGPTASEVIAAASRFAVAYPLFGRWGAPQMLACADWSAPRHTLHPPVADTGTTLVVVGTVHDPATPYQGAVAMVASLGNARLLTWEGVGHTAVGRSDCIGEHVTAYLSELTLPPDGARCPA